MLTVLKPSDEAAFAAIGSGAGWPATFSALFAVAAGCLVLTGWATGIETLKRIHPDLVAMNPVTACCLIAAGASIWLHHRNRIELGCGLGMMIALTALAKFADLAFGAVPVDRLLFDSLLAGPPGTQPNRMAPNTAGSLLLVGLALVLVARRERGAQLAAQALGIAVALISTFALVGYVFGIDPLTAVGPFIPMALHTGAALLVTAIGIISLSRDTPLTLVLRDSGPAGSMARLVLPCAVLTPIAIGAARLWGEKLGFYGLEAGVALAAVGNVVVTSSLLIASILALYRSDIVRKERETALMRSEHFNRTINEASPDCVSLLDADGNVVFSNDAALRAYGLDDLAELVGRPWGHRLDERSRVDVQVAIAAAREGRVGRLTIGLPGPDGGLCWYESLVSKLDDSDSQPITFIIMSRDITHQKGVEDQVRWAATHDALTRLPNRALFQTRLEQVVAAGGRPQFALLVLDVDHFKQVNDMLGHDAGDALLSTVATRLCNSVRKQDFVARLGGDEFAIILSDIRAES